MRLKIKDLKLALETLPQQLEAVDVYVHEDEQGGKTEFTYTDNVGKLASVILYAARLGITPEIRQVTKLYRKD